MVQDQVRRKEYELLLTDVQKSLISSFKPKCSDTIIAIPQWVFFSSRTFCQNVPFCSSHVTQAFQQMWTEVFGIEPLNHFRPMRKRSSQKTQGFKSYMRHFSLVPCLGEKKFHHLSLFCKIKNNLECTKVAAKISCSPMDRMATYNFNQ